MDHVVTLANALSLKVSSSAGKVRNKENLNSRRRRHHHEKIFGQNLLRDVTMVDNVYRTRSLGVATEGLPDQYADGVAAKVWEVYIGDKRTRTETYCKFMRKLLRDYGCRHVLDVACGTGIDSVLLLEQGFEVTSVDASDKMLKYALKERWNRRKEEAFDKWVIEEANWLTLPEDIKKPGDGYDAVICLGNSFAHLQDFTGDLREIRTCLRNFWTMTKPNGVLIIDHRNYDYILDTGKTPAKNIYYNSQHIKDIHTSIMYVDGKPTMVTMDYEMDTRAMHGKCDWTDTDVGKKEHNSAMAHSAHFRLSYYPHRLESFTKLLDDVFGRNCKHEVYGDFKPINKHDPPAFYIHIIQKQ